MTTYQDLSKIAPDILKKAQDLGFNNVTVAIPVPTTTEEVLARNICVDN